VAGTSGRVRIEVGYGLAGALPDSVCGRILDEKTLPAWDKKAYGRGIVDGYMELVRRTAMEYALDMPQELQDATGMQPLWCNVVERPDGADYVFDIAQIMDDERRMKLEAICKEMQSLANVQLYVVAVDCGGEPLDLYARSLVRAWGLPSDDKTHMALLLFDAGRTGEAKPENAMVLTGSRAMRMRGVMMGSVETVASSYGGSQWKKKDYGYSFYRVALYLAERLADGFELTLSKENKQAFSELHPWYEMVLGGILGLLLCLGVPFLILRHIIGLFTGLGGGGSSGGYSSYSSRSSSYSSHSSGGGGGGFGGGSSGGGGASR
ncbi:MAG: TPM domain-containing protein, partial [Victivallales bacterium]|nr:TPM domain-containing protein [Victivallales bacterium]